ncbi:hypothetical protein Taro_017625 [Colocasia esculenta]|uniref:Peptidase M14 domain-containing protein n=1 Tax=Colocasia esculenta TaxID=4460 RepID=A0A843UZZ0_COLES|nr:hypothetical protein [Colocasia esculenta]
MELPRRPLMGSLLSSSSLLAGACTCYCHFLLLFCLLVSRWRYAVAGDGGASDQSLTPILRDLYHSSDALLEEVRALVDRHPHKFAMDIMKAGDKSYSADILVVTYNHAISDIGSNSTFRMLLILMACILDRTFPVFQSFGQHGRELITSELALRLLYILSGDNTVLGMDPVSLSHILDNVVIKMVPMENINGRKLVESGELCERRNGTQILWFIDSHLDSSRPHFHIFSELKFAKLVDQALFMPYDHKNSTPDGFMSLAMKSILEEVNHHHCQDRCLVGSGGGSVGYLAHGTSTDYMYDILKVPFAFTFEIYGDAEASSKDCFKMFNPIDLTTFSKVLNDWCAAFLLIFEIGPRHLEKARANAVANSDKWISIDKNSIDTRLLGRNMRFRKMEGLELGIQELRTYFRLFMLSSVLLMFMFCSRISKSKFRQTKPSLPV